MRKKISLFSLMIILVAGCANMAPMSSRSTDTRTVGSFVGPDGSIDHEACSKFMAEKTAEEVEKERAEARNSELQMLPGALPGGLWGRILFKIFKGN